MSQRRSPAPLRRCAAALLGAVLVWCAAAPLARADDVSDAQAEASTAADQLADLEVRIRQAQADYAAALAAVGSRLIDGVAAQTGSQDAERAARSAQASVGSSARALYISGGQSAIYASALAATDAHELALRLTTAERLMTSVRDQAERAALAADRAADAAADALSGADRAVVTADRIEEHAAALESLLATAQARLDRLSSRAKRLERSRDAARALAAARVAAARAAGDAIADVRAQAVPAAYLALYRSAAATCPGMPWTLLAAVGQVESGHGRNNGPSSAGAVGPMQFMPATFAAYAVDGDRNGHADPWSPADAVFTAARYLCVNGAGSPATVAQALFAYNRAQWYVDLVLAVQAQVAATYR